MATFRSKPVLVQAVQWTEGHPTLPLPAHDGEQTLSEWSTGWKLWVAKSQQWCTIERGDWILAEGDGHGFSPRGARLILALPDREGTGGAGTRSREPPPSEG